MKESPGPLRTFPELSGCPESALLHGSGLFLSFYHGGYRVAGVPLRCPAGACLFGCPPILPLACFLAPIPLPPSRREGGEFLVCFAGGFAPGTPALDRSRHLQSFPNRHPAEWRLFTTRVPAAPAGANAPFEAERTGFQQAMPVPRPIQPRGCKGRSPLHKKTPKLPLPRWGRGVGGWGQNQN